MILEKIIFIKQVAFLVLLVCMLGFADKAETQIIIPDSVSIYSILSTDQITALKANETVKAERKRVRDETRLNASKASRSLYDEDYIVPEQKNFVKYVKKLVGMGEQVKIVNGQVVLDENGDPVLIPGISTIFDLYTKENPQREKLSAATDPDGLAFQFAPSDEEMGIQ